MGDVKLNLLERMIRDMDLTMAEKRDLIERITELVKNDILNKEDRDEIYR